MQRLMDILTWPHRKLYALLQPIWLPLLVVEVGILLVVLLFVWLKTA